jgi:hypothetical protein
MPDSKLSPGKALKIAPFQYKKELFKYFFGFTLKLKVLLNIFTSKQNSSA